MNIIEEKIKTLEKEMQDPSFWQDKTIAQEKVKELQSLKDEQSGIGKYDKGSAIITIFSGAGGDDAEDFSRMLFDMYVKFIQKKGWNITILHEHKNQIGGFRNIRFEVIGKMVYGTLKNESGVHRLVRISPFNAAKKRHTSFSMVEVIPRFQKKEDISILDEDVNIEFSKSGGPGGQNVNKRETAVRIVHIQTGLSVHSTGERSQAQNKERAMEILQGKLYRYEEEKKKKKEANFYISKTTDIQWGNQIRSYVLHPYKMVKDHRTGVESKNPDDVFNGNIDLFIEGEHDNKI